MAQWPLNGKTSAAGSSSSVRLRDVQAFCRAFWHHVCEPKTITNFPVQSAFLWLWSQFLVGTTQVLWLQVPPIPPWLSYPVKGMSLNHLQTIISGRYPQFWSPRESDIASMPCLIPWSWKMTPFWWWKIPHGLSQQLHVFRVKSMSGERSLCRNCQASLRETCCRVLGKNQQRGRTMGQSDFSWIPPKDGGYTGGNGWYTHQMRWGPLFRDRPIWWSIFRAPHSFDCFEC